MYFPFQLLSGNVRSMVVTAGAPRSSEESVTSIDTLQYAGVPLLSALSTALVTRAPYGRPVRVISWEHGCTGAGAARGIPPAAPSAHESAAKAATTIAVAMTGKEVANGST